MVERLKLLGGLALEVSWAALMLLLPITSLPLLSRAMGGSMVAPAALIPLSIIGVFWFIRYILKGGALPREIMPLLLFVTVALIASALAFFLDVPTFKQVGILGEDVGAIVTLFIGLVFYAITAGWLSRSEGWFSRTMKWLSIGGAVMLAYTLLQGYFIYFNDNYYPRWVRLVHQRISVGEFFLGRMTGTALEPSWMANELNMIFLPFWLAATITGWSAFRFRLWKFSIENILLVLGIGIMALSSRIGLLSLFLMAAFLIIYVNIQWGKRLRNWSMERFAKASAPMKRAARIFIPALIMLAFLVVYLGGAVVLVYAVSHVDPRLAKIFQVSSLAQFKVITQNVYTLANYLQFAERVVFWQGGLGVFNLHPFLGVGLGNAGFFFQQTLPAFGWNLPEILNSLARNAAVPNVKSMWVRLLAETGIVGFSAFIAWLYVMVRSAWALKGHNSKLFRMIGWGGLLVLVAFLFEGFSLDTFALPYLWVSLGMVSAAAMIMRRGEARDSYTKNTKDL